MKTMSLEQIFKDELHFSQCEFTGLAACWTHLKQYNKNKKLTRNNSDN